MRDTSGIESDWGEYIMIWERLILAAVATFCFYLFLQLGDNTPQSNLFGRNLTKAPNFIFNIPILSR